MPRKPKQHPPNSDTPNGDGFKSRSEGYEEGEEVARPRTLHNTNEKGPKCGQPRTGKSSSGTGICMKPAGWGTEHPGEGPCKIHGGNNPGYLKHLAVKRAKQNALAEIDATMLAYGKPIHIGPHEALLMEVQRTAGHVCWLSDKIQSIGQESGIDEAMQQWTLMGIRPSFWVDLYIEERKHLVNVSKAAIAAGVAERAVALAEEQGKLLAVAIRAILWDNELQLTPTQRAAAPQVIRRHLLALPMGDQNGYPVSQESQAVLIEP